MIKQTLEEMVRDIRRDIRDKVSSIGNYMENTALPFTLDSVKKIGLCATAPFVGLLNYEAKSRIYDSLSPYGSYHEDSLHSFAVATSFLSSPILTIIGLKYLGMDPESAAGIGLLFGIVDGISREFVYVIKDSIYIRRSGEFPPSLIGVLPSGIFNYLYLKYRMAKYTVYFNQKKPKEE